MTRTFRWILLAAPLAFTGCSDLMNSTDEVEIITLEEAEAQANEEIDQSNFDEELKALEKELAEAEAKG